MTDKYIKTKSGAVLRGKWEKSGDEFVVSARLGGRGAEMTGRLMHAVSASGRAEIVRLVSVVRDFGVGDVCLFAVSRDIS